MTHDTYPLLLLYLVSYSCRRSQAKKAIQGHQTPFKEDLLGSSLRTTAQPKLLKILPRGANLFQRNAASVSASESVVWFTFQRNFFCYCGQG